MFIPPTPIYSRRRPDRVRPAQSLTLPPGPAPRYDARFTGDVPEEGRRKGTLQNIPRARQLNDASNPDHVVMGLDQTLTSEKSMMKLNETKLIKLQIPPLVPASGDGDDRQAFLYLIIFLLACLERIITDRASAKKTEYKWLEEWSDEDYFYLETHIPDDSSGMEIDLNVTNGLIYARIARRTDGNMNSEPPAH